MDDPGPDLVLDLSQASGEYRGDIIDGFAPLYSDELKEALEQMNVDNVDYFSVKLRDPNDNALEGGLLAVQYHWLTGLY